MTSERLFKRRSMRTLKSIRVDLQLTQEEMAKKLDISYSSYQKKERGEQPLMAKELKTISILSNVKMEDIVIPK